MATAHERSSLSLDSETWKGSWKFQVSSLQNSRISINLCPPNPSHKCSGIWYLQCFPGRTSWFVSNTVNLTACAEQRIPKIHGTGRHVHRGAHMVVHQDIPHCKPIVFSERQRLEDSSLLLLLMEEIRIPSVKLT